MFFLVQRTEHVWVSALPRCQRAMSLPILYKEKHSRPFNMTHKDYVKKTITKREITFIAEGHFSV